MNNSNFLKAAAFLMCAMAVNGFCELTDSQVFYNQADQLSGAGKYSEAIPLYLKSIEKEESAKTHNDLGYAYYQVGDFTNAENQYKRSLELDTSNPKIYNNLGTLYYSLNQWDKAEENFTQAVACDPDYAKAHFNLAAVNYRKHNYLKAYRLYRKAKKKYPQAYQERKNSKRTEKDHAFIEKNSGLIAKEDMEKPVVEYDQPGGASAETIINSAKAVSNNIRSLSGRLTRTTTSGTNKMVAISKFYYVFPDKCRIETLEPTTAVLIANKDSIWFYSPKTKSAQKADALKTYVTDFLPIFPLRQIDAGYELKRLIDYDGCYIIQAKPKNHAGVLSAILVKINQRDFTVAAMELYDPNGRLISQSKYEDITMESDAFIAHKITVQVQGNGDYAKEELLLNRLTVNGTLQDELFRYEPDKDTEVLEPVVVNKEKGR